MRTHVLLIGTTPTYATLLEYRLTQQAAVTVEHVTTAEAGMQAIHDTTTVVVVDVHLPDTSGLDLMETLRAEHPNRCLLQLVRTDERALLAEALGRGATDFVRRGHNDLKRIEWWMRQMQNDHTDAVAHAGRSGAFGPETVGTDAAVQQVHSLMHRALNSSLSVAFVGEPGTGKAYLAQHMHQRSDRADTPLHVVNCTALAIDANTHPFESALQSADGGMLLLDRVAELSAAAQARLQRVLQASTADVRLLSTATHAIEQAVQEGTFRRDVYDRLFQLVVQLPPLRKRGRDVLLLAQQFLKDVAANTSDAPVSFSLDAHRSLLQHSWPGNIRELRTSIERAIVLADGNVITPTDLQLDPSSTKTRSLEATETETGDYEASIPSGSYSMFDVAKRHEEDGTDREPIEQPESHAAFSTRTPVLPLPELIRHAAYHAVHVNQGSRTNAADALAVSPETLNTILDESAFDVHVASATASDSDAAG